MSFRLLLDEMTEARLADYCEKLGHDVERVVEVDVLGPGSEDSEIAEYALSEDRILVTHDDDFLDYEGLDTLGVLFQPDDRASPFETANVVDGIEEHVSQEQVVEHDGAFHLTDDWLS